MLAPALAAIFIHAAFYMGNADTAFGFVPMLPTGTAAAHSFNAEITFTGAEYFFHDCL